MSANCNWTKTEEGDAYDTDCGHVVSTDIHDALDGPVQYCPHCGLEMYDGSEDDEDDLDEDELEEDEFEDEDEDEDEDLYDEVDD